jgi:hypothetical protein
MKISGMPKTSGLILQLVEEKCLPIGCMELWADGDFELITVGVKGMDPKYTGNNNNINCNWVVTWWQVFTELQMRKC